MRLRMHELKMSVPDRHGAIRSVQYMLMALTLFLLLLPESIWAVACDRAIGEAAIPSCRESLQSNPQDVDLLIQYADILLDLDRPVEAVELLETSFGKNPSNNTIRLKLSNARESAVKNTEDTGLNARTLQKLSALRCNTRTGQAALDACNASLKYQPQNVDFLLSKGDALMLLKQPAEAARTYDLALAQDKTNPVIQSKLKLAYAEAPGVQKGSAPAQDTLRHEPKSTKIAGDAMEENIKQVVRFSNASIDGNVSY